jgi:hypothetical protein
MELVPDTAAIAAEAIAVSTTAASTRSTAPLIEPPGSGMNLCWAPLPAVRFWTPLKPRPASLPVFAPVTRRATDPAAAAGMSADAATEIVATPVAVIGAMPMPVTSRVPPPSYDRLVLEADVTVMALHRLRRRRSRCRAVGWSTCRPR